MAVDLRLAAFYPQYNRAVSSEHNIKAKLESCAANRFTRSIAAAFNAKARSPIGRDDVTIQLQEA